MRAVMVRLYNKGRNSKLMPIFYVNKESRVTLFIVYDSERKLISKNLKWFSFYTLVRAMEIEAKSGLCKTIYFFKNIFYLEMMDEQ